MTQLMERIDFDKLRKMPPERKIKALRELQEKLNALIQERNAEIQQNQREIQDAQDFLKEAEDELRVLEEMESQAPDIKQVDVDKLLRRETKRTEPTRPRERELESIADEAPRRQPNPEDQRAYVNSLARQPVASIYERVNEIRDQIRNTGVITTYQQERLNVLDEALHAKEEAIMAGQYEPNKKAEHLLSAAEKAIQYASGAKNQFYRNQ